MSPNRVPLTPHAASQVGTVLESYEDADIPFLWFPSIGQFWVRSLPLQLFRDQQGSLQPECELALM